MLSESAHPSEGNELSCRERGLVMIHDATDHPPMQAPLAELERQLIGAYLASAGHDPHTLLLRNDAEARALLEAASRYASAALSEVEARCHYVRELHGEH